MLPLTLDLARLRLLLVGEGDAALRRLRLLEEAGARDLAIHAEAPSEALAAAAGTRLIRRLPAPREIAAAQLVLIADAAPAQRAELASIARAAGVLLHVEDAPDLSDVQMPAVLRRGDLVIAISTSGASPAFAAQLKRFLAGLIGPEWRDRLGELKMLRLIWRDAGAAPVTIARWTEAWVQRRGWLPAKGGSDDRATMQENAPAARAARH